VKLPRAIAMRLAREAVLLWGAVHLVVLLLGVRRFTLAAHVGVVALVLLLTFVDLRATKEHVLYADLAIGPRPVFGVVLVVAAALEVLATLAVAALIGVAPMELPF
jgi:hypothetical protein